LRARRPVAQNQRADILSLDPLAAQVSRRCRIAQAQLVSVGERGVDALLSQLGEDLPGDRGLADSSRSGQPQDRDQSILHKLSGAVV